LRRTRPIRWPTRPHCRRTAERVRMRGAARGGGGERSTCVPSSRYAGIHRFGLVMGRSAPSAHRERAGLVPRLVGPRARGAQRPLLGGGAAEVGTVARASSASRGDHDPSEDACRRLRAERRCAVCPTRHRRHDRGRPHPLRDRLQGQLATCPFSESREPYRSHRVPRRLPRPRQLPADDGTGPLRYKPAGGSRLRALLCVYRRGPGVSAHRWSRNLAHSKRFVRPAFLPKLIRNLIASRLGDKRQYVQALSQKIALGGTMFPNPITPTAHTLHSDTLLRRLLAGMSFFTMLMTIPQVLTIWFGHQAAGVSLVSWSAYLASAVLWFWFGIQKNDKNIYLPCVGWIVLDSAVIIGVF